MPSLHPTAVCVIYICFSLFFIQIAPLICLYLNYQVAASNLLALSIQNDFYVISHQISENKEIVHRIKQCDDLDIFYPLLLSRSLSLSPWDHLSCVFLVCVDFTLSQLGSGHSAWYHVRERQVERGRQWGPEQEKKRLKTDTHRLSANQK